MQKLKVIIIMSLIIQGHVAFSQKGYAISSGELIFSFVDAEVGGKNQSSEMRFSFFFHYGHYWNVDLTNNLGFYSGGFIRNIGFRLTENDRLDMYRAYTLGLPLAIKLGNFKDHKYLYAGGEYEFLFHFKHKRRVDGDKYKKTEWLSDRVNTLIPSVIVGMQFPIGMNLKFGYYLKDFLNRDFKGTEFREEVDFSNLKTQLYYISLSFNFRTDKYKEVFKKPEDAFVSL